MDKTEKLLAEYVNRAADLAELVRYDIQHNDNRITDKTVLALNAFIIASNAFEEFSDDNEGNLTLN